MPPKASLEEGRLRSWFGAWPYLNGVFPYDTVDPSGGLLMPFAEYNSSMLTTQFKAVVKVDPTYGGATGGIGYNSAYLAVIYGPIRLSRIRSTSRTIAFADTVWITWKPGPDGTLISLIENFSVFPPSSRYPTVHFRHLGRVANVAFVDGHVEAWADPARNPPMKDIPTDLTSLAERENVFDIGSTDELWDLE